MQQPKCCVFQVERKNQVSGRKGSINCELLSRDCCTVAVGDQGREVKDKKKATRRSNVRKKHTAVFKAKVIHQV